MSQPRTAAEIREAFLSFFEECGHQRLPSDLLVPSNDPTLLFTGAGMNQFKDEFLGKGRDLHRVTTSQKCLRVPDLENVGLTPRHHTFFEMLGNFSFGDYFKAETIPWEWRFFTEVLGWDAQRFVCTVYDDDDEAFDLWRNVIGMPEERIYRFGEKENFWPSSAPSQGPNGVCGPCSEIYWDQEPGNPLPDPAGLEELPGRFLEVGNFVFTQFDRRDGGELVPLPQRNIDVGLGLERIAAVAQGAANNFETDLFAPVLAQLQAGCGRTYGDHDDDDVRMRRIADHSRAVFFCIADGAVPGREGRGYVVRKILRRAIRDGIDLGYEAPFLADLMSGVQETMAAAYPELKEQEATIVAMVQAEEERFREVYQRGIERLEVLLEQRQDDTSGVFPGELAFELHDTYGFPVDITEVVAREHGLELDRDGFHASMAEQRQRARAGTDISVDVFAESLSSRLSGSGVPTTDFTGYAQLEATTAVAAVLDASGNPVEKLDPDQVGSVLLTSTPFYAEGGGQVGDQGLLTNPEGAVLFQVAGTSSEEGYFLHRGTAVAALGAGQELHACVDDRSRRATEKHHTATHLLHAALKEVLGEHVQQAGSHVGPERLRFDYTHPQAPSAEQLQEIEDRVAEVVMTATEVGVENTSLTAAKEQGVTALFGEKYGDQVRVVSVPGYSAELCGGTHVANVGAIGPFRLLGDRALAAGVRRIEAVAGSAARQAARHDQIRLRELEAALKVPAERLLERVEALKTKSKEAARAQQLALPDGKELAAELHGCDPLGWKHLGGLDADGLRRLSDQLRQIGGLPPVVLLTGGDAERVPFALICVAKGPFQAGVLAKQFGRLVQGGGGGRPDFAQGQGSKGDALEATVQDFGRTLATTA